MLRDQERSISHFSCKRRDKEMVRQRESGRERGLERERACGRGGVKDKKA